MATLTPKSPEQLLGDIVRLIRNRTDINSFKAGGGLVSVLEGVAKQIYATQVSVLKILELSDVDSLEGARLDDLAQTLKISNGVGGVGRQPATQATGIITIGSSFSKISSKIYAGKPAPFAGATTIYLTDASLFAASGQLYLGANTVSSFEGPINYSAITYTGAYYAVTLSGPLTKDHGYGDEVTFAQGGNRTIQSGTIVQVPARSDSNAVQFVITQSVTIPDGEAEIDASVTAIEFGANGNAAAQAITEFAGTAPFTGATVINSLAFVDGRDTESDSTLRQRIRDYPNTLARGTVGAITAALLQVSDSDTKTSITSANVIRPIVKGDPTTVYIDDGSVLQPIFVGQDYELLLAQASGLEQSFRTAQAPVTPAISLGSALGPFALEVGQTVTFIVDNVPYIFPNAGGIVASNYKDLLAATPYEIIRDFNSLADSPLEFRVYNGGKSIVAIDKTNEAEEIRVVSGDFQKILGFSTDAQRPIYLYKNAILQSFKGKTATITTRAFSSWVFQSSYTGLQVEVDSVAISIADITNADFSQFSTTISTATADQWRQVLQSKIPGVTIVFQDGRFVISSNKENSSSSQLKIVAGNWIATNGIFETAEESVGANKDYDFNRYTGDIRFVAKLLAGDKIEIASLNTRAYVQTTESPNGLYDLSSQVPGFGTGKFVIAFDGITEVKSVGTLSGAVLHVVSSDSSFNTVLLRDENVNNIWDDTEVGDYVYLVRNTGTTDITIPAANQIPALAEGIYRVKQIRRFANGKDDITIEVSDAQQTAFVTGAEYIVSIAGMVNVFKSTTIPQIVELTNGTSNTTIEDAMADVNATLIGGLAYRDGAQFFRIRSNTYLNGTTSILAVIGRATNILSVMSETSLQAHVANSTSGEVDGTFPVVTRVVPPGTEASGYGARSYLEIYENFTDVTALQTSNSTLTSAIWQSGNTIRYTSAVSLPTMFVNDTVIISGFSNSSNNGQYTVTNVNTISNYFDVTNQNRSDATDDETGASGLFTVERINKLDPASQSSSFVTTYPIGFQETWITGELLGWTGRTYNNSATAPFAGFTRSDQLVPPPGPADTNTDNLNYYRNISFRLEDVPLTNFDKFVVEMDLDPENKTVSVPMYKRATINSIVAITSGGKGKTIDFTLKDPEDSDKLFFDPTSPYVNFNFEDFKLFTKSVGVYKTQSDDSMSDLALVLRSSTFGGASRYRLIVNLPQTASKGDITVSHYNDFNNSEVETIIAAEMCSQATIAGTAVESGSYTVDTITTPSTNLRDITISTFTPATTPAAALGLAIFNANLSGTTRNGTQVIIRDTGDDGTSLPVILGAETLNVSTLIDLQGNTPSLATLNAAIAGSINLGATTGTGPVSLQPTQSGYQANIPATCINPGGNVIVFSAEQVARSPKTKGNAGNSWSIEVIDTGVGAPIISRSGTAITINLQGSALALSAVQALLNTLAGGPYLLVTSNGPGNITTFGPTPLSGGVDEQNIITLANGANASNGSFGAAGFTANNILRIGGIQSVGSPPVGAWPIVSTGTGTITFRVPNYNGLSSILAQTFQASVYPVSSYAIQTKTLNDLRDAINAYLPDSPIASTEAIGAAAGTADVLRPSGAGLPRPTFINYTNTSSLPSDVTDPSSAYTFHAFNCNFSGVASIYSYDSGSTSIKALVQSDDSIWPNTTQVTGTSYTPVNEEVYLIPTNASTIERWMAFPPTSSLSVQAEIERVNNASKVQISSELIGSDGAVFVKSNYANDMDIVLEGAASPVEGSAYVSILTSQSRAIPRRALAKISNAVSAELLRPFRLTPTGSSITAANTTNITSWLRTNARIRYEQGASTNLGRLIFLRNGQGAFSFVASEPLSDGNVTVTANSPSSGLATVTLVGGSGTLSARVGDMMYVRPGTTWGSTLIGCPSIGSGSSVLSSSLYGENSNPALTAYPGYPVVQVNSANEIVIIAPNFSGSTTNAITSSTDIVFVPSLFTEKNIRTNYIAGPKGAEILEDTTTSGTHATKYQYLGSNTELYAILKKVRGPFYVLITSNTITEGSTFTDTPVYADDDLLLDNCAVNTDDYVYLKGFGTSQDGEYRLIAHDGVKTMILYREAEADDIIQTTDLNNTTIPNVEGTVYWGRLCQPAVIHTQSGTLTTGLATVTGLTSTLGLRVGNTISGGGVPTGTTIASVDSLTQITMSENATTTGASTLTFGDADRTDYGYLSTQYDVDPRPIRIVDADSVLVGSQVRISSAVTGTTTWFPQDTLGTWEIKEIGYYAASGSGSIAQYIEFEIPNGAPNTSVDVTVGTANVGNVGFIEREPFTTFRFVQGWSADPSATDRSHLYLSPALSSYKISDSYGTEIIPQFKLDYETSPLTGIDGYKIFGGLIREAHRTIDGTPSSLTQFQGIKSVGTDVSILPPVPRSISLVFQIRTRDGVSVNTIAQVIRSAVATFVQGLGIGESVILSEVISIVQAIPGVTSVEISSTLPVDVDGVIPVSDNEKAVILDPDTDIEVGQ